MRYQGQADLPYMSKNEGRKMLLLGLVLLVCLGWVFQQGFSQKPLGPEIGLVPPPRIDARTALETHQRVEQEAVGEVAPVASAEVVELDRSILEGVTEGREDVDKVLEPAFFHLLNYVNSLPDETLEAAPETMGFEWDQLMNEAGRNQARGRFIRLRGRFFTQLWQYVLPYPNEAGLPWVWQGTFRHQNRGFMVTIIDKEFEPKTGVNGTPLELTGAFLKVYPYHSVNAEGGAIKTIPHVVVKSMRRLPEATMEQGYPWEFALGVFAAVLIAALLTLAYALGSRKSARQVESWRTQRLKGKVGKVKARLDAAGQADAKAEPGDTPAVPDEPPAKADAAPAETDAALAPPALPACPKCGAGCGPESAGAVVCATCLQRHHGACWADGCAACGGADALVRRDA